MVFRIYIEKKEPYAVEAKGVLSDIQKTLGINSLEKVRIFNRYDIEDISEENYDRSRDIIFSEPPVDEYYYENTPVSPEEARVFSVAYLPGQFDQRADSCEQCISLLTESERPFVRSAKVYALYGEISDSEFDKIKNYLINPVEAMLSPEEKPETLKLEYDIPEKVEVLDGFISFSDSGLLEYVKRFSLAMDTDDVLFLRDYFRDYEKRDPTITELRMIDTYWSDHCRHTTFLTEISGVTIEPEYVKKAYEEYLEDRERLGISKPSTLMDIATIGAKVLKHDGFLVNLDESDEINACSVKVEANVDGKKVPYLLMFKNETHNHPTEIEPFGGAATCLGGAIRDPLSGRAYVYQAMRVTGAADPRTPFEKTLKGKLPQRKIVTTAADGYSSYGNQIGLATGLVDEIYHPGYVAKRMEIGAVVGAAPEENVVRSAPLPGDVVILLGGKTGRDGCGGATGSSKSHTVQSLSSCGAEVQKGNPPEERKIQRLFRNKAVSTLIKRCNDFGAGGVSVAVGELADGLDIDLDAVPRKYEGLDGTELAISESQERMAVVVSPENVDKFISYADKENLLATVVAVVKEEARLTMTWKGNVIVDISREFLNSNGAKKYTDIFVGLDKEIFDNNKYDFEKTYNDLAEDLNICSKQGLTERFDSTIGASSVFLPYGGKRQLTPEQVMAAKLPTMGQDCSTASVMSYGFSPEVFEKSPFRGAVCAVAESIAKLVAAGCSRKKMYLTFQEYFERTQNNPERWGKPFSALLGALQAQKGFEVAAIGGKDSMSGTFENIDVVPTLVSFAVASEDADKLVSTEFKNIGHRVYAAFPLYDKDFLPDYKHFNQLYDNIYELFGQHKILAASAITKGGVAEAVFKMCIGNGYGFRFTDSLSLESLFGHFYGGIVFETAEEIPGYTYIGTIEESGLYYNGKTIDIDELTKKWSGVLENVYPMNAVEAASVKEYDCRLRPAVSPKIGIAKPKVIIPVFPGTNCEYDTARAFEKAGAEVQTYVIRNNGVRQVSESVADLSGLINKSQILMFPGGFSGGDEPDGSGKFIASFFRNPVLADAVNTLLQTGDGLILGICNGFQALIKLGLLPYGKICDMTENSPTLTFNSIGRHQSKMVRTRVSSTNTVWMNLCEQGEIHNVAISHGEGRLIAPDMVLSSLAANGQIITQYVDLFDKVTSDIRYNPNNSMDAIEGIASPDGRIFGKMGHSERKGSQVAKNVYTNPGDPDQGKDQKIFESGVNYFKI